MRVVKRLRTLRFRSYVLPVILAALAARAFMPAGFMTATEGPAGMRVADAQLCSFDKERRGVIELPGDQHDSSSCDHCLSPLGNAPIALFDVGAPVAIVAGLVRQLVSQVGHTAPLRTQLARGPPQA
jgi:hypothetical protein